MGQNREIPDECQKLPSYGAQSDSIRGVKVKGFLIRSRRCRSCSDSPMHFATGMAVAVAVAGKAVKCNVCSDDVSSAIEEAHSHFILSLGTTNVVEGLVGSAHPEVAEHLLGERFLSTTLLCIRKKPYQKTPPPPSPPMLIPFQQTICPPHLHLLLRLHLALT